MHDNDLLILLAKLSEKELKDFDLFLKKNFKNDSILNRLLKFLRKNHPEFEPTKVTYEKAHHFIFKAKAYNKRLVLNTISRLRNELKKYLVYKHQDSFEFERDYILLKLYKRYNLEKHFNKQLSSMMNSMSKGSKQDMWYWLHEMQLSDLYYYDSMKDQVNIKDANLNDAMNHLDSFYAAAKLKYSSELYNRKRVMQSSDIQIKFLDQIEEQDWGSEFVYHRLYQLALKMIRDKNDSTFYLLKEDFLKNSYHLGQNDQYIITTYLLNYTSSAIREDRQNFIEESFALLLHGAKNDIFILDGYYNPIHFLNTVDVAGQLEEFNLAEGFIKNYAKKLNPAQREYYTKFCKALLQFRKGDFEKCSKLLINIKSKTSFESLRVRWLELVSHVELGNEMLVVSKCASFEQFVNRDKVISLNLKSSVLFSIKIIRNLLSSKSNKEKLEREIKSTNFFYYKSWLLKKVRAM